MSTAEKSLSNQNKHLKGGEFLIKHRKSNSDAIPEAFSEELLMMKETCLDFLVAEILPLERAIDKDPSLMPGLLKKAGELGLLGVDVPEDFGGFGMGVTEAMLVAEGLGGGSSFAVAHSAHSGIGTMPIAIYGDQVQKEKYLSGLCTGDLLGAYCLTEPDSGSDANAAKTKAVISDDGKNYRITGQKMWITNGGFADLFIVFARIEDDKYLTAFIVESNQEGITINEEEKKLGIKGSSTVQIFFNEVEVPVENILGGRNNGFKIALNVLNIGRIKLAAAVMGGSKRSFKMALDYSRERRQFKKEIFEFGAIKQKLGIMASKIYGCESALYRATAQIDALREKLIEEGSKKDQAKLKAAEEYAIECAILKVIGSEVVDYVVDENVQIHGGMGYSADALAEKAYRDARINRIFEGTNEINRMLMVDMLLKKTMKGELDLMASAMDVMKDLTESPSIANDFTGPLSQERNTVENLKKVVLMISATAVQKFMMTLKEEQEILMCAADAMIAIYTAESCVMRTEYNIEQNHPDADVQKHMCKVALSEAVDIVNKASKEAIFSIESDDQTDLLLKGLSRFTRQIPFNIKESRRKIANHFAEKGGYA